MAFTISLSSTKLLKQPQKFPSHRIPCLTHVRNKSKPQIPYNKKRLNDAELASDLAAEVAKMKTRFLQREEAMKKSKELLFTGLCEYLVLKSEEVQKKWKKMDEEEKWVLVKGFVSEWGDNFQPLSARSVKELVDEYLHEQNPSEVVSSSDSSMLFPGLKRMMGFSQNK